MILKGSQRAGGGQLAAHLLNTKDNDHVEIHEIRGSLADDLKGAFQETEALSKGTRCQQPFFSLSLSPPEHEAVSIDVFEGAVEKIEQKLGLEGQPRAIIFHEKQGRRHAHCVWSRIDAQEMKAVNLPFFKMKLQDAARELYRENGWEMPRGLVNKQERNPLNFNRAEWHQAQRIQEDPKDIKAFFQQCWQVSDNRASFANALQERGYRLACGDKRGFVAVDYRGEVYSLSRSTGAKSKELTARLDDPKTLPSVDEVKTQFAVLMNQQLKGYVQEATRKSKQQLALLNEKKLRMKEQQQAERQKLRNTQQERRHMEVQDRSTRQAKGWRGIWQYVSGQSKQIKKQGIEEVQANRLRDKAQRQDLISKHLKERQGLQEKFVQLRETRREEMTQLKQYIDQYGRTKSPEKSALRQEFDKAVSSSQKQQTGTSAPSHDRKPPGWEMTR
jgi:hypothetical protein